MATRICEKAFTDHFECRRDILNFGSIPDQRPRSVNHYQIRQTAFPGSNPDAMKSIYDVLTKLIRFRNQPACVLAAFFALFLSGPSLPLQSQDLLVDIDPNGDFYDWEYKEALEYNGVLLFVSNGELWRTNGSTDGTVRLKDIGIVKSLTLAGSTVYFTGWNRNDTRWQLWKTKGTTYNTVKVKDLSSEPSELTAAGEILYFVTNDGVTGRELWKSDGTATGTVLVKDIIARGGSSNPTNLEVSNGILYFSANNGINGYEIWRSDGTQPGTIMLKDIRSGSKLSSSPSLMTDVNGELFFKANDGVHGTELWKSDGSASGTVMVKDIIAGITNTSIHNLTNVSGTLLFSANDGIHGEELWKSDGTATGTTMVKDLRPGSSGSMPFLELKSINNMLYFMAKASKGYNFWKSDGTPSGTTNLGVASNLGISTVPAQFTELNGSVYFFNGKMIGDVATVDLMREDGTSNLSAVTNILLYDFYDPTLPILTECKNALYFTGRRSTSEGLALFTSNGTPGGTRWIADTFQARHPNDFIKAGGLMYFVSRTKTSETLWKTDGTTAGTLMVTAMRYIDEVIEQNGLIYFTGIAQNPDRLYWDIYQSDGTPDGTSPMNFNGGTNKTGIQHLIPVGNKLFFVSNYTELWSFNGSVFSRLSEILYPNKLTGCSDHLYFYATDGIHDGELWKSDGSPAGTAMVKDINLMGASELDKFAVLDDKVYFTADDGVHGTELWRSDGTSPGTWMVKDLWFNDLNRNDIDDVVASNGSIYFVSKIDDIISTLWRTNGTDAGSVALAQVGLPVKLMPGLNGVFFVSKDYDDYNMWICMGTQQSTQTVNIGKNPFASAEPKFVTVNNIFYAAFANALWRSDGTIEGSYFIGQIGDNPYPLSALGDVLIYASMSHIYGNEVFTANVNELAGTAPVIASTVDEQIEIYPNPFSDRLFLNVTGDNISYDARIIDLNGQVYEVYEGLQYNIRNEVGKSISPGLYILEIHEREKNSVRKLIKN